MFIYLLTSKRDARAGAKIFALHLYNLHNIRYKLTVNSEHFAKNDFKREPTLNVQGCTHTNAQTLESVFRELGKGG